MNLTKLFKTQKGLDAKIVYQKVLEGRDLLPEKILALQVELGELANEWRGFKFWSEDVEPRTLCSYCKGTGHCHYTGFANPMEPCGECNGYPHANNPLLVEYVDCLHFILSIGIELAMDKESFAAHEEYAEIAKGLGVNKLLIGLMSSPVDLINGRKNKSETRFLYADIILGFTVLGQLLGFTTDQIEQAYYDKNKVNHERQANGY